MSLYDSVNVIYIFKDQYSDNYTAFQLLYYLSCDY